MQTPEQGVAEMISIHQTREQTLTNGLGSVCRARPFAVQCARLLPANTTCIQWGGRNQSAGNRGCNCPQEAAVPAMAFAHERGSLTITSHYDSMASDENLIGTRPDKSLQESATRGFPSEGRQRSWSGELFCGIWSSRPTLARVITSISPGMGLWL